MMSFVEGHIEETVKLDLNYPSVSERYFTKYYFVPKEKKKIENFNGKDILGNGDQDSTVEENSTETAELNVNIGAITPSGHENGLAKKNSERVVSSPDSSGHTCVMVHTNKLCLITLSHRHPVLARKKKITEV